jgi:chromate reductase
MIKTNMDNYLIISGTNRPESNTHQIALQYQQVLDGFGIKSVVLQLTGLDLMVRNPGYEKVERELIIPANKFILVTPEYNGSFPGALKCMIDISDYKICWWHKKALLAGVSTGRAGNLMGMVHLTAVLHNLKMIVHPYQLPISSVHKLKDEQGRLVDIPTLKSIHNQVQEFINF